MPDRLQLLLGRKVGGVLEVHVPTSNLMHLTFISQDVKFKIDYAVPSIGREFGSVFIDDQNVGTLVVSEGWAKVVCLCFGGLLSLI